MIKVSIIGKGTFGQKIESCIREDVQLVKPDDADWIVITTPNDLHYEMTKKWLLNGKNVFCEKPLTLTSKSSEELFLLADSMGVKLYVDDVFCWHVNRKMDFNLLKDCDFEWKKSGSYNANIIDNLAYHHFYLWAGINNIRVDEVVKKEFSLTSISFTVKLEVNKPTEEIFYINGSFVYDINSDEWIHTIDDGWELVDVKSDNDPLKDMLLKCFNDSVNFENNRKRTLNAVKICEEVKKVVLPKVLVVGGGIFGTTSAIALSTNGFNVTLHEELDDIMKCASNINQYRLHRGYHYPRSKETAHECLNGIKMFKRKYEDSVVNGNVNHYYSISSENSLITSEEYIKFLDDMKLDYNIHDSTKGVDLTVGVDEELFDSNKLKQQVKEKLFSSGVDVVLNKKTTQSDFLDRIVILSTYANINELVNYKTEYQYEVVEKPVVRLPKHYKDKSVVVMDGPFMCFDPYGDELHVLGNVVHAIHETNIGHEPIVSEELKKYLNNGIIKNPTITNIDKFIETGKRFFDDFDELEHIGSMYTIRTVLANKDDTDERPTIISGETWPDETTKWVSSDNPSVYSLFSGKIGTCVSTADSLVRSLKGLTKGN
jgi:hypothetical protein|tara:strand:- start:176 stop:1975 length:1800 start_codon:yes stop_codon:yes gene_type:complete